ncbi:STAS domain-containing protein [Kitasatospora viridis]|uniref:Anti-sigma factor antagonist n=1 Tax=Kitasatospora viridis TaxID=281105 RepID=A0A561SDV9_9ACTN|nr:STAS domain-containing protein [Kitasatospora viridis]TWF73028.1 anti-sigma B factor antagonist [Kitasatospora viridis]
MPTQNDPVTAPPTGALPVGGTLAAELRYPDAESALCVLVGELDIESLAPAQRALDQALARSPRVVVVDLSQVGFCDSSGLNLLLKARMTAVAAGIEFRLAAPSPTVRRVLELTRTDTVLSLHPSAEAALAATA